MRPSRTEPARPTSAATRRSRRARWAPRCSLGSGRPRENRKGAKIWGLRGGATARKGPDAQDLAARLSHFRLEGGTATDGEILIVVVREVQPASLLSAFFPHHTVIYVTPAGRPEDPD